MVQISLKLDIPTVKIINNLFYMNYDMKYCEFDPRDDVKEHVCFQVKTANICISTMTVFRPTPNRLKDSS